MKKNEKLIKLFKSCDKVTFTVTGCGEETFKTIEFKNAIEALEKQLNGSWISASERLPKEDEEVLVTTIGNQVCWAFRYLDEWNTCLSTFENNDVLAWMPLPEPYKEVENE